MSVNISLSSDKLASDSFNGAIYVNDVLSNVSAGEELRQLHSVKAKLVADVSTSSEHIKNTVFDHYKQFIETSKEISALEREIYQLSALLSEQKNVIENLMELCGLEKQSPCSVSLHSAGNTQQNPLQVLMHRVDGIADVINNLKPNEKILLQGELTLLSESCLDPVQPVFLVLLTDTFLVCHPTSHGPKRRFQLHASHRLDQVAVVNVKRAACDQPYAELIMQLMIFPDQLYLKCETARIKKQWLDGIENAKRAVEREKNLHRQATIRAKRRKNSTSSTPRLNDPRARLAQIVAENAEPIHEISEAQEVDELTAERAEDLEWLRDIENDLQEEISHRHMENAVDILLEVKQCRCRDPDINARFAACEKTVVRILSEEIKRPGALHGGAKALSRPLTLLKSLGRSTFALDLYLKRRSASLSALVREFTISEEPVSYVRHVSELFVRDILEVAQEFRTKTPDLPLVLQWSCSELSLLLSLIRRHVLEVAPTMAVLTNSWRILTRQLDQLTRAGLDLTFEVNRLLAPSLRSALELNFTTITESTRLRIHEERWAPYHLETESALNRYLEEMSDLELCIDWAISIHEANSLDIAQSACEFARVARSLSHDLSLLKSSGSLRALSIDFIRTLWSDYCELLVEASDSDVHEQTCKFVMNQLVPLCEQIYREEIIQILIQKRFPRLLEFSDKKEVIDTREEDV